jgi:hypothetical protein
VLHLNVLKVDRVLHMRCVWEAGRGTNGSHGRGPPGGRVKSRHG